MLKGLNTDIALLGGKITLTSGRERAENQLWMLINFDKFRVYMPTYTAGLHALIQRPASFLIQYRTVIIGNLLRVVSMYVKNLAILSVDIVNNLADRKDYNVLVEHKFTQSEQPSITVKFLG